MALLACLPFPSASPIPPQVIIIYSLTSKETVTELNALLRTGKRGGGASGCLNSALILTGEGRAATAREEMLLTQ